MRQHRQILEHEGLGADVDGEAAEYGDIHRAAVREEVYRRGRVRGDTLRAADFEEIHRAAECEQTHRAAVGESEDKRREKERVRGRSLPPDPVDAAHITRRHT
ncbi:hypothetical protein [Streptomyces sp. NPDC055055]